MHLNQDGFSLTELLLSIVISSIILGAAFGSYAIINRNFEYQNDMRHISQTARMVIDIINKDIRMAGYKDPAAANIASTDAISITECPGGTGCSQQTGSLDQITVIYDKSPTVRHKIRYYATAYPSGTLSTDRYRLMKRLDTCNPSASACSSDANFTNQYDEPIADYIEELSFVATNGSCQSGVIKKGCGTIRWIYPDSVSIRSSLRGGTCNDLMLAFDANNSTALECNSSHPTPDGSMLLNLNFNDFVRIVGVKFSTAAHLDGGSYIDYQELSYMHSGGNNSLPYTASTISYPYGSNYITSIQSGLYSRYGSGGSNWLCADEPCASNFAAWPLNIHGLDTTCSAISNTVRCKRDTDSQPASDFSKYATKMAVLDLSDVFKCSYADSSSPCILDNHESSIHLSEFQLEAEVFDGNFSPREVETTVLIRSPNTHGNVDRANNFNSKTDRLLRDRFIGSTVIRNLHYQSS